ncbi:response regulator [Sulfurimonas aquatica]|uniref:histidine kinase n=1 Tax=Sulfurimonas aquatica TaxID=2672570 RepID=A0A975B0L4_9BACT|nr:hybrid sensor histidine kinase/response regulator [Sulfurimonas aquatica]QSZ42032.1 response regulator [Sulfurimonas aquatica]
MYNIDDIKHFKKMCSDISILMLDDEVIITDAYSDVASRFFNSIDISNNPAEVLKAYTSTKYDIIYTDINMPGINGVELIKEIKKINPKQKFIVISASDESDKLLDLLALNVSGFIVKPFNLQKFIDISMDQVSIILQSRIMKKELLTVTKEKEEQQKMLIQQSKLAQTGEMISMISHQWRQPLSSITTVIAGLKTRLQLGLYEQKENPLEAMTNDFTKAFDKIETSAKFLSKTINDFRNFYRPNKEKSFFNVCSAIENVFEMIQVTSHDITTNIECIDIDGASITSYEGELKQVFMSIINNAIDALKEKSIKNKKISIFIVVKENNIDVSIIDNAGGIPNEIMENIFLPYFSTKNEKNGTGLGLHMAKTIIEQHLQGSLSARNSQEFQGAEFLITIPKNLTQG